MPIASLRITDFRNISSAQITPLTSGLNIISGSNGSGKTSFLEAIYYLGLGKSFRSALATRLIHHETDKFSLFAQLLGQSGQTLPIGIERTRQGISRMRIAERELATIAELAALLPIRIINSQSHQLFEAGPAFRRKYLDWGLFYESDHFLTCWRQFERILKQRNALLRDKRPSRELDVWTDELVKAGLVLDQLRRQYVIELTPIICEMAEALLSITDLRIDYQSGWDEKYDYASVLKQNYLEEYRLGCTQYGPHRADLNMTVDGVSVKHFLSRGQQKLLICAMILAQGIRLMRYANKGLVYLVDDLPSELDLRSREKLISLLSQQQTQIFITAIQHETICNFINKLNVPMEVFHVEQGSFGLSTLDHSRRAPHQAQG